MRICKPFKIYNIEQKRAKRINCALREYHEDDTSKELEAYESVWGMPRLMETTKDVVSCEKLRGAANER